jgi:hypothetical protein
MALDWLDAARYADTNGFSIDGGRHMWLWRDWVIQAFNDNMPYDRFLIEQLAGDLLPNRTEAQLIATGFQRNNMVTHEGGTIPEENPHQLQRRPREDARRVGARTDARLRAVSRPQVRSDHAEGLLPVYAFFNTLSDKGLDGNAGVNPGPMIRAKTVLRSTENRVARKRSRARSRRSRNQDDDAGALGKSGTRACCPRPRNLRCIR